VNKPLGLYDFAPVSDGGTALILANSEIAITSSSMPVYVESSASATDFITFPSRDCRTGFEAASLAMKKALKEANLHVNDIQIAEFYDQSTLLEMIALEDLGFAQKGKAWQDIYESRQSNKEYYEVSGQKLFVNTDGGLKADGNPLGATGGAQIFELVKQLQGKAGERQVKTDRELRFGCALEFEGFGTKAYVHILARD
jgi:acetyl-CoA C-acetyltransferase